MSNFHQVNNSDRLAQNYVPCLGQSRTKLYFLVQDREEQDHTLSSSTSQYRPFKGVHPLGPFLSQSLAYIHPVPTSLPKLHLLIPVSVPFSSSPQFSPSSYSSSQHILFPPPLSSCPIFFPGPFSHPVLAINPFPPSSSLLVASSLQVISYFRSRYYIFPSQFLLHYSCLSSLPPALPSPPRYFTSSYILFPSQLLPMSLPIPVPGFWFYTSLFKLFSFCLTFSTFPLSVPAPSLPFSTPCNQLSPLSFPVVCTFSLSVTTH